MFCLDVAFALIGDWASGTRISHSAVLLGTPVCLCVTVPQCVCVCVSVCVCDIVLIAVCGALIILIILPCDKNKYVIISS